MTLKPTFFSASAAKFAIICWSAAVPSTSRMGALDFAWTVSAITNTANIAPIAPMAPMAPMAKNDRR
jgi:hypothetical protein